MNDREQRECRDLVLQITEAIRLLREDRHIPGATVYRSVFTDSVYVGNGLKRLADSVGQPLIRGRKNLEDFQEGMGHGAGVEEEWFRFGGVRFYRLIPQEEWKNPTTQKKEEPI